MLWVLLWLGEIERDFTQLSIQNEFIQIMKEYPFLNIMMILKDISLMKIEEVFNAPTIGWAPSEGISFFY